LLFSVLITRGCGLLKQDDGKGSGFPWKMQIIGKLLYRPEACNTSTLYRPKACIAGTGAQKDMASHFLIKNNWDDGVLYFTIHSAFFVSRFAREIKLKFF
jgi:hypothetical protein